jgi:hypothetical protein
MNSMPTGMGSKMPSSMNSMPTGMGSMPQAQSQFRDIKRTRNPSYLDNEDNEDDEDGNAVLNEEDHTNRFKKEEKEKEKENKKQLQNFQKSKTRRQHQSKDSVEGFHGSVEIESRNLKNILLALLLSFIGYLVVYANMNNYIPVSEMSPQLKKFKHFIYGGIFCVITYICLEVF